MLIFGIDNKGAPMCVLRGYVWGYVPWDIPLISVSLCPHFRGLTDTLIVSNYGVSHKEAFQEPPQIRGIFIGAIDTKVIGESVPEFPEVLCKIVKKVIGAK